MHKAQELTFTVVPEPETGPDFAAYYNACVPALPGSITQGSTREQALQRAEGAILCHLEGLAADGLPIPEDETEEALVEVPV